VDPGVPEVLFFHTVAIQRYGGGAGIRDKGALEAAIARPWSSFAGREAFPTPFDKAAAICESIINRHPFVDGNKRTGLSAGAYLLSTFGFELDASSSELEALAMDIEAGRMGLEDASGWFEAHAREV
jgi:death-on-curing protein